MDEAARSRRHAHLAKLIQLFGWLDAEKFLEGGVSAGFVRGKSGGEATT